MSYNSSTALDRAAPATAFFNLGANDIDTVAVETDFGAIERDWRAFEQSAAGHVFQSFDWISAWHGTIGRRQGIVPLIVTGRTASGRLLFLLPLGATRLFGLTALTWLGGSQADLKCGLFDADFLARVTDIEWDHLWQRIRARLPPVDLIYLPDQPERIGALRNPFILWRTHAQPDLTHNTRLGRDWVAYYAAKRGKASRKEDRRRARRLEALGKLDFAVIRDPDAVPLILQKLMTDKGTLLARIGVSNPFEQSSVREFFRRQADRMYPSGQAHLSILTLDGKPIAVDWGLIFQKRYYYLMSAYDLEYSHFAPGTRQLQHLMRWCMDNDVDCFDFGVGELEYKYEWCEDHVVLFAAIEGCGWAGRAAALLLSLKTALKYRVKTSKRIWPLVQRLRVLTFSWLKRAA